MPIVSLLPSTTEILFAIGAGDDVVAVTLECDHPAAARERQVVSTSTTPEGLSVREIDQFVAAMASWEDRCRLDADALARIDADLVVTQDVCAVCAVDANASFARPGPSLIDGIETVAEILHPGANDCVPDAVLVRGRRPTTPQSGQEPAAMRAAFRALSTDQVMTRYTPPTRASTVIHSHMAPPVSGSVDSSSRNWGFPISA